MRRNPRSTQADVGQFIEPGNRKPMSDQPIPYVLTDEALEALENIYQ